MKQRRYVIDLSAHIAECEANYARLMRLLPDLSDTDRRTFSVRLGESEPRVRFEVAQRCPYTTVVRIVQDAHPAPGQEDAGASGDPGQDTGQGPAQHGQGPAQQVPGLAETSLVIRIYHDAKAAEVIEYQNQRGFHAVYDYPNARMRHPDEKAQVNRFLGEFLGVCLEHGVSSEQSILA